jgi:hypothetical protein
MKETLLRKITETSSLKEISSDQLGNRVGVREGRLYSVLPFLQQGSGQIFKDDGRDISSAADICFTIDPFILLVCEI